MNTTAYEFICSAGGSFRRTSGRGRLVRCALSVAAFVAVVTVASALRAADAGPKLAPIQLSPERRQLIGVQLATAEEEELVDRIDITGLVEPDERLEGDVQTRFAGWLRQVFVNQTYQYVRKGAPLFTIYSPDLVSAEQEYQIALQASRQVADSSVDSVASGAKSLVTAALERLKLFGVSPREISRLEREGTIRDALEIDSPMTGYVVERNALPNMYAQPGTKLYSIAGLSDVWIYAAVFQSQLGEIKVADPVSVTVDSYPGRTFEGRVDFIWEAIDPVTRTARVRCSLPNPEGLLKLGMYVDVALKPRLGRGLVIPDSGVLRTGTHNLVFVDRGEGYLTPTDVELGPHVGGTFVVRKGLKAGDRIVSSANFLIDSESQLQAAAGTFAPPPPGVSAAAGQPGASKVAGSLEMTTDPTPPARGADKVRVTVRDAEGKPVAGANVSITFYMAAMPAMGMAAMRAQTNATDQGNGTYAAEVNLQSGGTWQVTIVATKDGQTVASKQFDISVSGPMAM